MDQHNNTIKNRFIQSPYLWSFTTYFTEGFPYTVIRQISSLFFRDMGARLESVGLTSLFGLPWILKFLWGPHVDRFSTKRSWLLTTQGVLVLVMLLTAFLAPVSWGVQAIAVLFFLGSFFAATHDIAIDGYYMEALDADGQAKFIGYRVMAYRIAMITGTGVIATLGTVTNWFIAFFAGAALFGLFFVYHCFFLPRVEQKKLPFSRLVKTFAKLKVLLGILVLALVVVGIRWYYQSDYYTQLKETYPFLKKLYFSHWISIVLFISLLLIFLFRNVLKNAITKDPDSFYSKAFLTFIDRDKIGIIFAVIILIRTGEFMLSLMVAPFFVDLGIKVHYGWISSAVGLPLSIAGAMIGGWMISRFTLKKVIWPFLLLQNLTNGVYMILALSLQKFITLNTGAGTLQSIGTINLSLVASVHAFDQFAGGLGTSVLMTFLMRICLKEYKAAHYAIGTGFMSISGVIVGVLGGFLCAWLGYGYFFGISFLLSIPGMIAVLYLPDHIYHKNIV